MLSASYLGLVFVIFMFFEASALRDGFIYSKEVPLSQEIIHYSFKDSYSLIIQHPLEIITTRIDKPNQIDEKIIEEEIQTVPFSLGQTQRQIFFMSNGFLNY